VPLGACSGIFWHRHRAVPCLEPLVRGQARHRHRHRADGESTPANVHTLPRQHVHKVGALIPLAASAFCDATAARAQPVRPIAAPARPYAATACNRTGSRVIVKRGGQKRRRASLPHRALVVPTVNHPESHKLARLCIVQLHGHGRQSAERDQNLFHSLCRALIR